MPYAVNKNIINGIGFSGLAGMMHAAFTAGDKIGEDIIEAGGGLTNNVLLKEDGKLHLAEQEAICADLDKAMADCIKRQWDLVEKRKAWLDTKL